MPVRDFELADIDTGIFLCRHLHKLAGYPEDEYHTDDLIVTLVRAKTSKQVGIFIAEEDKSIVGYAFMMMSRTIFNADETDAHEIAFWVHPEYRKMRIGTELVEACEAWALSKNAKRIIINALYSDPDQNRFINLLEHRGYAKLEVTLKKELA